MQDSSRCKYMDLANYCVLECYINHSGLEQHLLITRSASGKSDSIPEASYKVVSSSRGRLVGGAGPPSTPSQQASGWLVPAGSLLFLYRSDHPPRRALEPEAPSSGTKIRSLILQEMKQPRGAHFEASELQAGSGKDSSLPHLGEERISHGCDQ